MSTVDQYFLVYNIVSWLGWVYLAFLGLPYLTLFVPIQTSSATQEEISNMVAFYNATIGHLILLECFQTIEIVHAVLGVVKSSPITASLQIFGRLHCIFLAILFPTWETSLKSDEWVAKYLFLGYYGAAVCWCSSELVRYPFYIVKLLKLDPQNALVYAVNWLRYSAFIVLYPIGVSGELLCYYAVVQWFGDNKDSDLVTKWEYRMPNKLNIEYSLRLYMMGAIVVVSVGGVYLFQYMMAQRKKFFKKK